MVTRVRAEGYDQCKQMVAQYEQGSATLYIVFVGSRLPETGKSWCPDCVLGEEVLENCLKSVPAPAVILWVEVGDRPFWKDPHNPFRLDRELQLKYIPTLMHWTQNSYRRRIEMEQCANPDLVQLFFTGQSEEESEADGSQSNN